jgi:hypothetical protein
VTSSLGHGGGRTDVMTMERCYDLPDDVSRSMCFPRLPSRAIQKHGDRGERMAHQVGMLRAGDRRVDRIALICSSRGYATE